MLATRASVISMGSLLEGMKGGGGIGQASAYPRCEKSHRATITTALDARKRPGSAAPVGVAAPEVDRAPVRFAVDRHAGAALLHAECVAHHRDRRHRRLLRLHRVHAADHAPVGVDRGAL